MRSAARPAAGGPGSADGLPRRAAGGSRRTDGVWSGGSTRARMWCRRRTSWAAESWVLGRRWRLRCRTWRTGSFSDPVGSGSNTAALELVSGAQTRSAGVPGSQERRAVGGRDLRDGPRQVRRRDRVLEDPQDVFGRHDRVGMVMGRALAGLGRRVGGNEPGTGSDRGAGGPRCVDRSAPLAPGRGEVSQQAEALPCPPGSLPILPPDLSHCRTPHTLLRGAVPPARRLGEACRFGATVAGFFLLAAARPMLSTARVRVRADPSSRRSAVRCGRRGERRWSAGSRESRRGRATGRWAAAWRRAR